MNSDHVKGSAKDMAGKIQRKAGEAVGDHEMQAKGLARQAEGKAQKKVGDVRDAAQALTRKP